MSMNPPAEVRLVGMIDLAARKGLKTLSLIKGDELQLYLRTMTQGTIELAKKEGAAGDPRRGLPPGENRLLHDTGLGPGGEPRTCWAAPRFPTPEWSKRL